MKSRLFVFFSLICIFLGIFFTGCTKNREYIPNESVTLSFSKIPSSNDIYVINKTGLSDAEVNLVVSLQGIVAKISPSIYIIEPGVADRASYIGYLADFEDSGSVLHYNDSQNLPWTPLSLLDHFLPSITNSGFVTYTLSDDNAGVNMASTISGVEGWLAVPSELREGVIGLGLVEKRDLTVEDQRPVKMMESVFNEYKDRLSKKLLIHQSEKATGLRDFGIQQNAFIFYTSETYTEKTFRSEVLSWAEDNIPILGWTDSEIGFVNNISPEGKYIVAMDHAYNNSFLIGKTLDIPQQKYINDAVIDSSKHYAAIVMSDGDNIQWTQGGFSTFSEKLLLGIDSPISWTFPTLLAEIAPEVTSYTYNRATINDYFVSGISGVGYFHLGQYPRECLDGHTLDTALLMEKSNMSIVTIKESKPFIGFNEAKFEDELDSYAAHPVIKGGIIQMDPDRYEAGNGKVYFRNNKPFACVRLSLWHPSNEYSGVTKSWLDEQVEKANNYPANITSTEGYSIINVHPWSISVEDLKYFIDNLDDDIVLVSAEELIDLMAANVAR